MKAGRLSQAIPVVASAEAVILFSVGPHSMAIHAEAVAKIRKDRGLMPAEIGCSTIVSAAELFGLRPGSGARLLALRGGVAVRVDRVERMVEAYDLRPLPRAFQGSECDWFRGLAVVEGAVAPLVNPEAFERQAQKQEDASFAQAFDSLFQEAAR
jgi:hypothetical protein